MPTTPFFNSLGAAQVDSTKENFRQETAPDGQPWQALRPATIRARKKRNPSRLSILRESGSLAGSIRYEATEDGVEAGSVHHLSAGHQFGATIRKQGGRRRMAGRRFARRDEAPEGHEVAIRTHQVTIPSRPFPGISAEDERRIAAEAEDWLMGG
jgi:phage virion morphogenesis protein